MDYDDLGMTNELISDMGPNVRINYENYNILVPK